MAECELHCPPLPEALAKSKPGKKIVLCTDFSSSLSASSSSSSSSSSAFPPDDLVEDGEEEMMSVYSSSADSDSDSGDVQCPLVKNLAPSQVPHTCAPDVWEWCTSLVLFPVVPLTGSGCVCCVPESVRRRRRQR